MKLLTVGKSAIFAAIVIIGSMFTLSGYAQLSGQDQEKEEETAFGNFLYSEASDATRAEMIELLNREDPTIGIFAHSLSMGLPIDETLEAAVRNNSDRGREYYVSAAFLLPLLDSADNIRFTTYDFDDMDKADSAREVLKRFFDDREILSFTPEWHYGESHMQVAVSELKELVKEYDSNNYWYKEDDLSKNPKPSRPIFIQMFSDNGSVVINDLDRINKADDNSTLPVVFVFNDNFERPVSRMTQPVTVKSVIADYNGNNLMVTPTPEWSLREYHTLADIDELYDVFRVPEKDDVDSERWQEIENRIKQDGIRESFIITILPGGGASAGASGSSDDNKSSNGLGSGLEVLGDGAVVNRLDKIAVAKSLGYTELPVVFYYVDNQRVKPYRLGLRHLAYVAVQAGMSPSSVAFTGVGTPGTTTGGNGGFGPPPPVPPTPTPPRPPVTPEPPEPPRCPSPPCAL